MGERRCTVFILIHTCAHSLTYYHRFQQARQQLSMPLLPRGSYRGMATETPIVQEGRTCEAQSSIFRGPSSFWLPCTIYKGPLGPLLASWKDMARELKRRRAITVLLGHYLLWYRILATVAQAHCSHGWAGCVMGIPLIWWFYRRWFPIWIILKLWNESEPVCKTARNQCTVWPWFFFLAPHHEGEFFSPSNPL